MQRPDDTIAEPCPVPDARSSTVQPGGGALSEPLQRGTTRAALLVQAPADAGSTNGLREPGSKECAAGGRSVGGADSFDGNEADSASFPSDVSGSPQAGSARFAIKRSPGVIPAVGPTLTRSASGLSKIQSRTP